MKQIPITVYKQNYTVIDGTGHGVVSPFADIGALIWVYNADVNFGAVPSSTPCVLSYDADNMSYPVPRPERGFSVHGQGNTILAGYEHYAIAAHGDGNTIIGHDGLNDIVTTGNNVTILAGGGNDFTLVGYYDKYYSISYRAPPCANVTWQGQEGDDYFMGTLTNSTISGGAGNDQLFVAGDHNIITTEDGDDGVVLRGLKDSVLDTGAGNDGVKVFNSSAITVRTGAGDDSINVAGLDCIIDAGTGNDTISSSGAQVFGGDGNDKITLRIGVTADAGNGNDLMSASNTADVLYGGNGNDTITAKSGDDFINGGFGDDTIDGGKGIDTLSFAGAWQPVVVDMSKHVATGQGADTFKGIETVIGSGGNDILTGDKHANTLSGGMGADIIRGGAGSDTLRGGTGNDTFIFTKKDAATGPDHITDFWAGDKINLRDFSKGKHATDLADLVQVSDDAAGTTISVSVAGQFISVAVLDNVHRVSLSDIIVA